MDINKPQRSDQLDQLNQFVQVNQNLNSINSPNSIIPTDDIKEMYQEIFDDFEDIQPGLQADIQTHTRYSKLLSVGQVFKNYKELCQYLGEEIKVGKSKQIQQKEWERFFIWNRDGNKYIITEIHQAPQSRIDGRSNKELRGYSDIVNTIMIYMLLYGEREEGQLGYSYTKTQLRKDVLKLVNKDYYNIRKDSKRASRELQLDPRTLYFLDNQVSDRMRKMSDRGIRILEDEGLIDKSKERFIQYIDINEYQATGEKRVIIRKVRDDDYEGIQALLNIKACGNWWEKSEQHWKMMNQGESFFHDQEFEEKENGELKKGLWIANEGRRLEEGLMDFDLTEDNHEGAKINNASVGAGAKAKRDRIKEYERQARIRDEQIKEYLSEGGTKKIDPRDKFLMQFTDFIYSLAEENGEYIVQGKDGHVYCTDKGIERLIGESNYFGYARKKGEYWVNMFEKTCIVSLSPELLTMKLMDKMASSSRKQLISMPEAQLQLNQMTKEWVYDKVADNGKWMDFKNKFRIQHGTGSQDLQKDADEFIKRYISVENVTSQYRWREYTDEKGKVWKVRYADNDMMFNNSNLNSILFNKHRGSYVMHGEAADEEDVILWSVPQDGMLCTNCVELINLARKIWEENKWFPIRGYLGGIWNAESKTEMNCFILILGESGLEVLKNAWDEEIQKINLF